MRRLILAVIAALPLFGAACTREPGDEQALVDRSALSVQEMMGKMGDLPRDMMRKARAVMVCPRVFKAGFFAGGQGGGCLLLTRSGNGTWSYPAFYGLGSGSFGLQFGVQDAQLMLMILTQKGLDAVLDSQFKIGANASIAVATIGAEIQGSTTAAVGADIVAFAMSRGLFGGIALEGSIMSTRTEWNQAYYGQPFGARQIVVQMQGVNPGADPLRQVLTRYGAEAPATATSQPPLSSQGAPPLTAAPPAQGYAPNGAPPLQNYTPGTRGPIQEQPLAAPGR
jgi:lipid-binding SYLF domain-containing protein